MHAFDVINSGTFVYGFQVLSSTGVIHYGRKVLSHRTGASGLTGSLQDTDP